MPELTPEEEEKQARADLAAAEEPVPEPEIPEEPDEDTNDVEVGLEFNKAGRIVNFHILYRPPPAWPEFDFEGNEITKSREAEPEPMPTPETAYRVASKEFARFNLVAGRKYRLEGSNVVYDESLPMAELDPEPASAGTPTTEAIAERAKAIYAERQAKGQPGDPASDWAQAERELRK